MRNWYNRKYIVLHEPISERTGRTFERKLAEVEAKGFKLVGQPTFTPIYIGIPPVIVIYGTVLLKA